MIAPLYQAFQNGCLPPVWLFVGPPNSEKSLAALLLAQQILGASQAQMDSGYYPNFFRLQKKADDVEIGIDDVRQLINYLKNTAPLPGWRVVVIEGIDTLNRHCQNALLKTLEEPPAQTLILTTAVTAARVLPTLRSRCVRLVFRAAEEVMPEENRQLYENIGEAATLATQGRFETIIPMVEKLAQNEQSFKLALTMLEQFVYRLIVNYTMAHSTAVSDNIPIEHWLNVQQSLNQFLYEALLTHLDKKHLLLACFIIIENPKEIPGATHA